MNILAATPGERRSRRPSRDNVPRQGGRVKRALGWRAAALAFLPWLASGLTGCAQPPRLVEREGLTMGSTLHLTAWTKDDRTAQAAFDAVFTEFARLDGLLSVWRAGSDVLKINAAAGDHPVPVDADVREVLHLAHQASEWTNGAFDVTFGVLTDLWKFDQDQDNTVPDPEAVRQRLPLIDYRAVAIDDRAGTVFLTRKGMRLHLGGIGKGYAVDRAADIFRRRGIRDFMIQAGGDMYVGGRRGDRPWRLGIQDPRGPANHSFATVELSDSTFSTSGDYERFFIKDGRRYHHILDLRAGEPARGCRSVTLVTDRAVFADALAKGVFILGPAAGMALIERLPHIEGVIVGAANEVLVSKGLEGRFVQLAPPTE
jgi:FAD:protein FMN transferase